MITNVSTEDLADVVRTLARFAQKKYHGTEKWKMIPCAMLYAGVSMLARGKSPKDDVLKLVDLYYNINAEHIN